MRGVARLTRLPVTEKIEGSNPFAPAIKISPATGIFYVAGENADPDLVTNIAGLGFVAELRQTKSCIASGTADVLR